MQFLRRVFNFYIFSNIHVAFAAASLTKITLISLSNASNELPIFVFFATILSYNYIRIYRKSTIKNWLSNWIDANKIGIVLLCAISFIGILYVGFNLNVRSLLFLIPFGGCTLFYVFPLPLLTKTTTTLRTLAGFKIFLIAFCWAGITVLLPVVNYEITFSSDLVIIFLQRFLFIIVITLPFDIRDVNYDATSLKTLPQLLGIEKTKRLGMFLLMLFLGLLFFRTSLNQNLIRIEFAIALVSLLLLIRSKEKQNNYYSTFFVESIPIVWLLLILI